MAWSVLYGRYDDAVRAVCRSQLSDYPGAVDDMVQETFLRLHRFGHTIIDPNSLQAWLRRTAKRACQDYRKRPCVRHEQSTPAVEDKPSTEALALLVEDGDLVDHVLAQVTPKQKLLLVQYYLLGRSHREIADLLGSTPSSVKTLLDRARKQAREAMRERLGLLIPPALWDWGQRIAIAVRDLQPAMLAIMAVPIVALTVGRGTLVPDYAPRVIVEAPAGRSLAASPPSLPRSVGGPAELPGVSEGSGRDSGPAGADRAARAQPAEGNEHAEPLPTQTVTVPVLGHEVQTYEAPDSPPDRYVGVGTPQTGEILGYEVREGEPEYQAVETACAPLPDSGNVNCQ